MAHGQLSCAPAWTNGCRQVDLSLHTAPPQHVHGQRDTVAALGLHAQLEPHQRNGPECPNLVLISITSAIVNKTAVMSYATFTRHCA